MSAEDVEPVEGSKIFSTGLFAPIEEHEGAQRGPDLRKPWKRNETESADSITVSTSGRQSTSINPDLPAGILVLKTPSPTEPTYIRAGDFASFSWTFTNLLVSPTAVNVEIFCTENLHTYTIAHNQSIEASSVIWNTSEALHDHEAHIITAKYTLSIYDVDGDALDVPSAGYLAPFQWTLGVYLPQQYTPWQKHVSYINGGVAQAPPLLSLFLTFLFGFLLLLI